MRKIDTRFMTKPILVDMDGIFCDFVTGLYEIAEDLYPEIVSILPNIDTLSMFYVDDCFDDIIIKQKIKDCANDPRIFEILKPYDGAVDGVKDLSERALAAGYGTMICTAPHASNLPCYVQKASWIEKYFGHDWLNNLMLVREKSACLGTVLIDDKPSPYGKFVQTWEHIIFDRSYNRHVHGKRIYDFSEKSNQELINWIVNKDHVSF